MAVACAGTTDKDNKDKRPTRTFPILQVPSMMDPSERIPFVASHFWDPFFKDAETYRCDSTYIAGVSSAELEQAMSNYLMLQEQLSLEEARKNISDFALRLLESESNDSTLKLLKGVGDIFERYCYDPNSPVRDEDLYTPYAVVMAQSEQLSHSRRAAYAQEADLSSLNVRGSKAADFSFSDKAGHIYSLYGVEADFTILFFSNPGCTACKEIIDNLSSSEDIDRLLAQGRLAVVNVYIDEELEEWYNYMIHYPLTWYNGFDHNHIIRDDELYNVRAIPSLYLLDKDKTVILKDADTQRFFGTLENILNL